MQIEGNYMLRCLALAQLGKLSVAPNPMVGAVIVHKGQIIGEGYHRQYGGTHAEVNAINAVSDKTMLLNSTLYVNLEPCSHKGKTPPCTQLIINKKIPRVVIGCLDPFPKVSGSGIKQLRNAGVEVVTDVMKDEAIKLNRYHINAHTKQRPYVILKWAQSSDGYLDRIRKDISEKPVQLSNPATLRYVHKMRSEVSAIMVGTNTAWLDNPSLTVRHWVGKSPVRILLDRTLRVPSSYHLHNGATPTLVFTEQTLQGENAPSPLPPPEGDSCAEVKNTEYIPIDFSESVIPQIFKALYERKLYSLLVEGGACLHKSFLDAGMWDELQIETTPHKLGYGVKSPVCELNKIAEYQRTIRFTTEICNENSQSFIQVYYCKKL